MPKGPKLVVRLCRGENMSDIQVAQIAPPVDARKLCTAAANKFKGFKPQRVFDCDTGREITKADGALVSEQLQTVFVCTKKGGWEGAVAKQANVTNNPAPCKQRANTTLDPVAKAEACRNGLPPAELSKLSQVSILLPPRSELHGSQLAAAEQTAIDQAQEVLQEHNMCILYNALTPDEIAQIYAEYQSLLDFSSSSAVGEKDASKRSGTRFFNCACQVGPNCGFQGWRIGAEGSKRTLDLDSEGSRESVWRRVVTAMGLDHVARVEVVTSHKGCRHQDWHVDAPRGLTVIFAVVDVDVQKGPTQMDFTIPFNAILEGHPKVKGCSGPATCHAAMPAGAVLMFNANCSHRGTANLSGADRPILVLDCSPPCASDGASLLYSEPSITAGMAKGQKAA